MNDLIGHRTQHARGIGGCSNSPNNQPTNKHKHKHKHSLIVFELSTTKKSSCCSLGWLVGWLSSVGLMMMVGGWMATRRRRGLARTTPVIWSESETGVYCQYFTGRRYCSGLSVRRGSSRVHKRTTNVVFMTSHGYV